MSAEGNLAQQIASSFTWWLLQMKDGLSVRQDPTSSISFSHIRSVAQMQLVTVTVLSCHLK